ncbi:uncharacterized protein F5891DRAFT_979283 [Suillus fuscotomentosus]|uniref:Uncharacterized protein n=1 Tax=Suillus fuscotomentosus TaxID=1912939 RepID=A0AAD4E8Q6_9AGAM|nr:uncharacterized protein F5891DRAFT_979283 [Suillus fuscotomentosus]KAG1901795.1 hypothetical protein F5891DRAFT_979283 [Suillus fuscotomentosus]
MLDRPTRYAYDPGRRCDVWFHLSCSPNVLISAVRMGRPSWLLFGPVQMLGSLGWAYRWAQLGPSWLFLAQENVFGLAYMISEGLTVGPGWHQMISEGPINKNNELDGLHDLRRTDGWALLVICGPRECIWSRKGRSIRIWGVHLVSEGKLMVGPSGMFFIHVQVQEFPDRPSRIFLWPGVGVSSLRVHLRIVGMSDGWAQSISVWSRVPKGPTGYAQQVRKVW